MLILDTFVTSRHIPALFPVMNAIPPSVVKRLDPPTGAVLDNREVRNSCGVSE